MIKFKELFINNKTHSLGCGIICGVKNETILYGEESPRLGVNAISSETTVFGGFILETMMTMLLVLVVYATTVDENNRSSPMLPPLLIGLTVTVAHMICIPFTG